MKDKWHFTSGFFHRARQVTEVLARTLAAFSSTS